MLQKLMTLGCVLGMAALSNAQKIGHLDAAGAPLLDATENKIRQTVAKRIEGDMLKNLTLQTGTNEGKTFYYLAAERFKKGNLYSKIAFPLTEKNGQLSLTSARKGCLMECIGANCEMTIKVPCQTLESKALADQETCSTKVTFK